jgi:hypothetical protein
MSKYTKREKVCQLCYNCKFDCVQIEPIEYCENFLKGYTRFEYLRFLNEQNTNIRKLCDKHGLSYNRMMAMLNGREIMKYKYAYYLNSAIFEKNEYILYADKFENEEVANG